MNWFKTTLVFIPLFLLFLEVIFMDSFRSHPNFTPTTAQNNNLYQFENILHLSDLQPTNLKYSGFRQEIEFSLKNVGVVFSSKLSPLLQVTALQKVIKTSNINGRELRFIDLSSSHPYATFENN